MSSWDLDLAFYIQEKISGEPEIFITLQDKIGVDSEGSRKMSGLRLLTSERRPGGERGHQAAMVSHCLSWGRAFLYFPQG